MNKFLHHYSQERLGADHFGVDEYDIQMGAEDLDERVSDVKDAIDLLKIPPPPSKEELMLYRKQILKRIRYLESQIKNLPPGSRRKNLERKIAKLKGGSKNIFDNNSPVLNAMFMGSLVTLATPLLAQSYFRRDIESPAQLLAGQKLETWDDNDYSATPTYSTLMHRYPKFYALEFLLASGLFYTWIKSGLRRQAKENDQ